MKNNTLFYVCLFTSILYLKKKSFCKSNPLEKNSLLFQNNNYLITKLE